MPHSIGCLGLGLSPTLVAGSVVESGKIISSQLMIVTTIECDVAPLQLF